MKSFSKIRKGSMLILPLAACSIFGVLVAQEPRREQEKNTPPASRSENDRSTDKNRRDGGRNTSPANPVREGERGTRPEGGRPEVGTDAKERLFKELNLSKDERAKVESIIAAREEKMRELQQSTMKAIRDAIGDEKFQSFIKNTAKPIRGAGPVNPPRDGDKGRPEGERKAGPVNPPRDGDKGRPEGERKAGPVNPPRDGDKGRPEGERKGPGVGPEARERMLNQLNLSKDVRAKVESIMATQQEKIKDIIAKGREGNVDREKIMAEVRELQQNMVKNLREILGDEKFQSFMKMGPMFNRGAGPEAPQPENGGPKRRDSSREKQ